MAGFPTIIGRAEFMDIIDVVPSVPVKIDTGAYRSSIHATNIKENGSKLSFDLLGHPISPVVYHMEVDEFDTVNITNSFGKSEKRYEIKMRVKIGPKVFNTRITLADRSKNFYPVLVGRKMLHGRFLVDVTKGNADRMKLRKEFNIDSPLDEEDME